MKSKQLQDDYATMHYWWNGLNRALWHYSNRLPDENSKVLRGEASNKLYEIKKLMESSFSKPIGDAVMEEIRCGKKRK